MANEPERQEPELPREGSGPTPENAPPAASSSDNAPAGRIRPPGRKAGEHPAASRGNGTRRAGNSRGGTRPGKSRSSASRTGASRSGRSGTARSEAGGTGSSRRGRKPQPPRDAVPPNSRSTAAGGSRDGGGSVRRSRKTQSGRSAPAEGIGSRVRKTWDTVSGTAEAAVRETARSTRKTATIIGYSIRKASRRRRLQDLYRHLGEICYQSGKSGKAHEPVDTQSRELIREADRLHLELEELERKEAALRRR